MNEKHVSFNFRLEAFHRSVYHRLPPAYPIPMRGQLTWCLSQKPVLGVSQVSASCLMGQVKLVELIIAEP